MSPGEILDGQWSPRDGHENDRRGRHECRCPDPGRGGCRCEDDGENAPEADPSVRRRCP